MKGSIHYRKDAGWWFVLWYDPATQKGAKIVWYKGERMYHRKMAEKLLAVMQSDIEQGTFRLERYTQKGWTDVVPYLYEWLKAVGPTLKPGTLKDYQNSVRNHLEPFFTQHPFQLHEIQYDVLLKLLNSIKREGKGKFNVMMCLHACLKHALLSHRIIAMPVFPERKRYNIVKQPPKWLPSDRQDAIIKAIPEDHQLIFWFLKYHLRRPGEAMALHKSDYDFRAETFLIRRGISARKVVEFTKTNKAHVVPAHSAFLEKMKTLPVWHDPTSPFFFTCRTSRSEGHRYTDTILNKLWNEAASKCGETLSLYDGTKKSTAGQMVNELGYSLSELKEAGDWADIRSVESYAQIEVARRRELLEGRGRIVRLNEGKKKALSRNYPKSR